MRAAMTPRELRTQVAAILNGVNPAPGIPADAIIHAAIAHGVGPQMGVSEFARELRGDAAALVAESARLEVLHAALINDELRRVLEALAGAGLKVVVVKGAHLAHAVYGRPHMRVRSDSDLLIQPLDRDGVEQLVRACGYTRPTHVRGRVILGQFHMERRDRSDVTHALDIHWRVASPLLVERLLPARAVIESARPLPRLGPDAFGPSLPHALAFAALHLAAHHWPDPDLLWLYDLRTIAEAMPADDETAFVALSTTGRFAALAAEVLRVAHDMFPSPKLEALIASLPSDPGEPSLRLLAGRRPIDDLRLDLRYATTRERFQLVREHLFPDRDYIRAAAPGTPLATAYARRIATGARRWLSRQN
jgi:hypothetical protein